MTITPLSPDTYRVEWEGGFVEAMVVGGWAGSAYHVLVTDGDLPASIDHLVRVAVVDVHLDRLASQLPITT